MGCLGELCLKSGGVLSWVETCMPVGEPKASVVFGELLRQHRLAAGLTQAALAERAA